MREPSKKNRIDFAYDALLAHGLHNLNKSKTHIYSKFSTGILKITQRKNVSFNQDRVHFDTMIRAIEYYLAIYRQQSDKIKYNNFKEQLKSAKISNDDLYVFESAGFYKIGRSNNVDRRVKSGTMNPFPIVKILSLEGCGSWERILHNRLAKYNQRGEWYVINDNVKDVIDECHKVYQDL